MACSTDERRPGTSRAAWAALIGGIGAGFMILGALWLIAEGDPDNAAIIAALAAVFAASVPIAARKPCG